MIDTDFERYGITNFDPMEVQIKTGSPLFGINVQTMVSLQRYREYIRRRVLLLDDGLTTGTHKSGWHAKGLAVDSALYPEDGPANIHHIFKGAIKANFRGIGIYWDGTRYTTHFDLRPNYAFWGAWKNEAAGINDWQWVSILQDPAKAVKI